MDSTHQMWERTITFDNKECDLTFCQNMNDFTLSVQQTVATDKELPPMVVALLLDLFKEVEELEEVEAELRIQLQAKIDSDA